MGSLTPQIMFASLKQVGLVILAIAIGTILLELLLYYVFEKTLKHKYAAPIMLLAPAVIGITLLFIYPILYEFRLAFSNMSLDNFKKSFNITEPTLAKLQQHGVPETVLVQLKGLTDQVFASEDAFLTELQGTLGAEAVTQYKDVFLQNVENNNGIVRITKRNLFALKKQIPEGIVLKLQEQKGMIGAAFSSQKEFLKTL